MFRTFLLASAAVLCLAPGAAFAQEEQGTVVLEPQTTQETAAAEAATPVRVKAPPPASAEDEEDANKKGLYVSGAFGMSITDAVDWKQNNLNGNIEMRKTVNFAGALGMNLTKYFGAELEVSYRNSDLDELSVDGGGSADLSGEHKITAGLLNANFEPFPEADFSPYMSFGVGMAQHDIDIDPLPAMGIAGTDGSRTVFAYQVGLGFNYNWTKKFQTFLGYRYFGTDRPSIRPTEFDFGSHEVRMGLRRYF